MPMAMAVALGMPVRTPTFLIAALTKAARVAVSKAIAMAIIITTIGYDCCKLLLRPVFVLRITNV